MATRRGEGYVLRGRRPGAVWVALGATFLAVLLIVLPDLGRTAQMIGAMVLAPLEFGVSRTVAAADRLIETVQQAGALSDQNRQYREELDRMEATLVRLRELELENRDLRQMLGLRDVAPAGTLLPASVIGRDPVALIAAVTIDRGWDDGVAKNQAVVTWRGVVGRVVEVHPRTAKVLLISDVNSALSVRVQDPASRANGTVRGIGDGRLLLQYVLRSDRLQTDDQVITTGLGGVFPAGLVLGRVVQVRLREADAFQEALIEPAVDLRNLERTYVLLRPPGGS